MARLRLIVLTMLMLVNSLQAQPATRPATRPAFPAATLEETAAGKAAVERIKRGASELEVAKTRCMEKLRGSQRYREMLSRLDVAQEKMQAVQDGGNAQQFADATLTLRSARQQLDALQKAAMEADKDLQTAKAEMDAASKHYENLKLQHAAEVEQARLHHPRGIMFVIDASGSMLSVYDDVRNEVGKAINNLAEEQSFGVILDQGTTSLMLQGGLLAATPRNKAVALDFLRKSYVRSKSDLRSVIAVIKLKPDLIWVATDGEPDGVETGKFLADVRKANADKKVRINTVLKYATTDGQGKDDKAVAFLWQLANENGGMCLGKDGRPVLQAMPLDTQGGAKRSAERVTGPSIFDVP